MAIPARMRMLRLPQCPGRCSSSKHAHRATFTILCSVGRDTAARHYLTAQCVASHPVYLCMRPFSLRRLLRSAPRSQAPVDVEHTRGCRPLPASVENTTPVQAAPGVCAAIAHVKGTSASQVLAVRSQRSKARRPAIRQRQHDARVRAKDQRTLSFKNTGARHILFKTLL